MDNQPVSRAVILWMTPNEPSETEGPSSGAITVRSRDSCTEALLLLAFCCRSS
jgi:hypothetical protein